MCYTRRARTHSHTHPHQHHSHSFLAHHCLSTATVYRAVPFIYCHILPFVCIELSLMPMVRQETVLRGGVHLDAEVHHPALLGGQAHLEGSLGARQPCCAAAVYGSEQLHTPGFCIVLVPNLRLHHVSKSRPVCQHVATHMSRGLLP